ncbi:Pentatricopeptide repeat-containing protein [Rhynchospora pubera]|uniref:Pentatricopeptide repeat-containing protein n=1 Tax=Rhynchospora pubera TaxID=906938 RepID=A0AAV8EDT7_9POAL|nr:Pentatricopeptide repeat-containing protein [Rhynchospora pubera]
MASAALRLNPRLHHHRLLLSRLYSATLPPPPSSHSQSQSQSRLKTAIRHESNPDRLASLFLSAGSDPSFHGDRQIYSYTIRRLASSRRTDLIESLLSSSLSSFPSPSEGFLIRIISLYSQSGMVAHAVRTFNQIKSVTDRSFSALLSAYFDNKMFDQLHKAFNTLPIELGFSPGIASYNVFLKCLCSEGKLVTARAVLAEMPKKGLEPDIISYNEVLNGYLKKGDEPGFNEFLKLVYQREFRPNATTYNLRIRLLCNKGRSFEAKELVDYMILNKIYPNLLTFNTIIDGFCKEGKVSSAMRVFKRMKEVILVDCTGITPNFETYSLLIKGLVENQLFLPAVEVCKECAEKKWAPPFQAVRKLVDGLLDISRKEAEQVVRNVRKVVKGDAVDEWKKIEASFSFLFCCFKTNKKTLLILSN